MLIILGSFIAGSNTPLVDCYNGQIDTIPPYSQTLHKHVELENEIHSMHILREKKVNEFRRIIETECDDKISEDYEVIQFKENINLGKVKLGLEVAQKL